MTRGARGWLGGVALAWGIGMAAAAPGWGSEFPEAARWISAVDTLAYAEVARPEEVIDRLESERVTRLIRAVPGLDAAIREEPELRTFWQVVQHLAQVLDTQPVEGVRRLVGGGIVLAVEGTRGPERVYAIVTPNDVAFLERAHDELLALTRRHAEQEGRPDPVQEIDYRGVRSYSVDGGEAHAILGGVLVIANGGEALKTLIDRIEDGGAAAPLAEDATWTARRAAAGHASAWAVVNLKRVRAIDPDSEAIDPGAVFVFGPWVEAAQKAEWAALTLTWTNERLAAELNMTQPEGGYSPAMAGYLPPEGRGAAEPLSVPGQILSGTLWRDLAAIWAARGEIFPPEAQQGFAQLDAFAGQFFGGRDFGSGVLGALGDQWQVVVARQDAEALDPVPAVVLPAFALVVRVDPDDADFALRLRAAFQSFIGLANLGAAETKAPPLMLGSEEFAGSTISTARFLPPTDRPADEPVHQRHNFSPSAVQVGDHFVISSSLALAKDLITALQAQADRDEKITDATLVLEADGPALAGLIEQNREPLVLQNMLEEGNDRARAEEEISLLKTVVESLGHGTLTAADTADGLRIRLNFDLGE